MKKSAKFIGLAILLSGLYSGIVKAGGEEAVAEMPQSIPFEKGPYKVRVERSHFIEMRDGVRLSTDLYFPEGFEGKLPIIMERTPYNKARFRLVDQEQPISHYSKAYYYASHGYVFAVQDRRGKFESEGDYTIGYNDIDDSEDTLNWFEEQDWFNGNVGMIGCSIPGGNVIKAGMTQHKSLKGLVPQSAGFGHGTAGNTMARAFLRGGVQNAFMPLWMHFSGSKLFYRPSKRLDRDEYLKIIDYFDPAPKKGTLIDIFDFETNDMRSEYMDKILHLPQVEIDDNLGSTANDWDDIASQAPMSPWWLAGDYLDDGEKVSGGAIHVNSWHDYSVLETIRQYEHFKKNAVTEWARDNQFVIIGPLGHCAMPSLTSQTVNGERVLGDARFDSWGTYLKWWDYTLKGMENDFAATTPKIQYFLPGANEWRSTEEWPLQGTEYKKLYLTSSGQANTREGNGLLKWEKPSKAMSDTYVYDPADPVIIYSKSVSFGSSDMQELEMRDDILVYSGAPLEKDVEITGHMKAKIWLSTDVPDTDLAVKILDVYPDGRAYAVQESYLRLRYRDGFDQEVMLEPGVIYPIDLDMLVTANLFKAGHSIRIEVTSSNFPTYSRNLNTGGNNALESDYQSATVTIHHGPETPSYIELPVVN